MSRFKDNPMMEPVFFTEPGRYTYRGQRLFKGGGSGGVKYDNLEDLYAEQTESARLLRRMAEDNLPDAVDSYVESSKRFLGPEYVERRVGDVQADMAQANSQERAATERNLASMGVNPNDPRFAGSMRAAETSNAARSAAGSNMARNEAEMLSNAVSKDMVGTFTGQSNTAAQQMSSAASGLGNLYSQQSQQDAQRRQSAGNAVGNIVGGGMMAYDTFFKKDGGRIKYSGVQHYMDGGEVESYGSRPDGTPKGSGYFGEIPGKDGGVSTELSVGVEFDGKETLIPLLVPTLSEDEVAHLVGGGKETPEILDKAVSHAVERMKSGKSPFAEAGDDVSRYATGGQVRPQGFLSPQAPPPPPAAGQQQRPQPFGAGESRTAMSALRDNPSMGGEGLARGLDAVGAKGAAIDAGIGKDKMFRSADEARSAADAYRTAADAATDPAMKSQYERASNALLKSHNLQPSVVSETAGAGVAEALPVNMGGPTVAGEVAAGGAMTPAAAPATSAAIDTALGATGTEAVGAGMSVGAEAAATNAAIDTALAGGAQAAAGEAAVGTAASALGTGAGALATALPWIGAAAAVGSLLELWADGGEVGTQVNDMRDGDRVPGEWTENRDTVPALLVEEEHVVNAEGSKLLTHDFLDRVNKIGLRLRERGISPKKIEAIAGSAKGVA